MRGIHNRCTPPWPHGSFAAGVCLCANLERHQLSATELPPMRLFRDGGKLHSLSNRRLFVFRVLRLDGFVWRPSSLIQKTLEFFPRLSNRSPHWRHFRTLLCWCQCWKLETGGQAVLKFIEPRNNHERVKNRWKSCHYVMARWELMSGDRTSHEKAAPGVHVAFSLQPTWCFSNLKQMGASNSTSLSIVALSLASSPSR